MSTVNRSINVTASTTGAITELDKIRQRAIELGRDMAVQARDSSSSSRELIQSLNEQIRLVEKRNRLATEGELLEAKTKFEQTGDKAQYKRDVEQIRGFSREDKIQVDILKEILESIVSQTREGIRSDRERTIEQIENDERLARESTSAGGEAELRSIVSRAIADDDVPEDKEDKGSGRTPAERLKSLSGLIQETDMYTMGFRGVDRTLDRVSQDKDNNRLTRGLAIAGGAIAGFLATSIRAAERQIESKGDLFRATGVSGSYGDVKDMTEADVNARAAQVNMALGTHMGQREMTRLISYERARGIDATQLAQISKYSKGNWGEERPDLIYGAISQMLDDNGLNQARTNETLQQILQLQQKEFMATGSSHAGDNIRLFNRILQNQEHADPGRAGQQIGQIDSMVKGAGIQQEAVMFSLYQQKEGGSWLDYLAEKQKVAGGKVGRMFISQILGDESMGEEDKLMSLVSLFNGDVKFAREIFKGGGIEGVTPGGATSAEDFEGKAIEMTGGGENIIKLSSSWVTDSFADVGEKAVWLAEQLVGAGQKVATMFSGNSSNSNRTHE